MRLNWKLAYASVSLVSLAAPAFAAEAAPASGATDEAPAIVVTARRRDESRQDVPLVVNAVSAQTLSKLNIRDFKDITSVVPGLSLVPNPNGIGSASSMRGVNHDVNVSANQGTIQYYLDDTPVSSDTVFQTMFDLGQVEVLRGPQGTLRGRATPSGSITLTTHQPDLYRPGAYIDGTVGSADLTNVNFGIGVPIIQEKLAIRIAGVYDYNRGDRVTSVNSSAQPYNESKALRASVRFEPTDWLKTGFAYTTLHREGQGFDQVQSFALTDPTVAATTGAPNYGTISLADRKSVEFAPRTTNVNFERYNWHAQVSFAGQNLFYSGSWQSTSYNSATPNDTGGYFRNLSLFQRPVTNATDESHEIRLQNATRLAGLFDYVVGYFQLNADSSTTLTNGTLAAPGFAINVPTSIPRTGTKEQSYFGNVTVHFGDKTELAGGLRHIKFTDPGQNLYVFGRLTSPAQDNSFSKTIYSATLRHRFNDSLMVYASTGSSARPGAHAIGDFSAAPFSPNELAHTHTPPETSKSYELGFKSDWLDKKLQVNATYYHQDFKNYPYRAAGSGIFYLNYPDGVHATVSQFAFISAVPVKIDGVEGEINFRPSKHFSLNASIDYTKSKVGAAEMACTPAGIVGVPTVTALQNALPAGEHLGVCNSANGQPANFQSPWNGTVQAEYSHEVKGDIEGFVRGLVSWHGSSINDPSNPYDNVNGYALLNAYLGLRDSRGAWSLTFYGKNLTNLTEINTLNASPTNLSQISPSTTYVSNYGLVTITPPREFGVNLRIAFGSR